MKLNTVCTGGYCLIEKLQVSKGSPLWNMILHGCWWEPATLFTFRRSDKTLQTCEGTTSPTFIYFCAVTLYRPDGRKRDVPNDKYDSYNLDKYEYLVYVASCRMSTAEHTLSRSCLQIK